MRLQCKQTNFSLHLIQRCYIRFAHVLASFKAITWNEKSLTAQRMRIYKETHGYGTKIGLSALQDCLLELYVRNLKGKLK